MVSCPNSRSLSVRIGAIGFASALALGGASALAVHEDLDFPAAIHEGTCAEPSEVVDELDNLVRLPEDAPAERARAGAQIVHGLPDDEELDLTVDDLLAADHILAMFDAEGENIFACGPIGAYTFEEGDDLVFGLRSQGDSPHSGVAIIENDDDESEIEISLMNNTPAPAATPEG